MPARKYPISYYYVSPQNLERIRSFMQVTGDTEKTLIMQYVRGWIARNRDYYLELARFDAAKRRIVLSEWGQIVVEKDVEALPPYLDETNNNNIPVGNPLRDIILSPEAVNRQPISYITLGQQNLALLRVAIHYDRDNAIGFVSRVVAEHLDRNWDKLYAPQLEAENFENWR